MTKRDREDDAPYIEEKLGETRVLITRCPGCPTSYSIDEMHPDYRRVKAALDRGDRSVLFCYHKARYDAAVVVN